MTVSIAVRLNMRGVKKLTQNCSYPSTNKPRASVERFTVYKNYRPEVSCATSLTISASLETLVKTVRVVAYASERNKTKAGKKKNVFR